MSAVHKARYEVFQEYFSAALLDAIENGDYGRPSIGKQEAMIRFEEELTRVTFRAWHELLRPCLLNNISLLQEMKHVLNMNFLSVVAVGHPELSGEWVARPYPAQWLMECVDRFHSSWIDYWSTAKANSVRLGLDEYECWKAVEEAKQELLDTCEDWVDNIESSQSRSS